MTKRNNSKHRISRRLGANLWGDEKSPFLKKNYFCGQHGVVMRVRRLTDYGVQLVAKQKLKNYYGEITEKQFKSLFKLAKKSKGDTSQNLVSFLESRLQTVVYRANFAPTIFAARQLVNHGHVLVNGKKVDISSYRVKESDVISIKKSSQNIKLISETLDEMKRDVPDYLDLDDKDKKVVFIRSPEFSEIPYPVEMDPNLVVEYYSRN